ncbi:GPP34 family phosphoprotein [Nonomuraea sp. NPDC050394]|uniref:GOLPH3/VPS74 family protein n=1 Tax=Nonomuraea sp. NPDC050394 TaxID=3364363 RepID=UPI00379AF0B6
MDDPNLVIAEELVLLTHQTDGRPLLTSEPLGFVSTAGILSELAVRNRIEMRNGNIRVRDAAATGDGELDDVLSTLAGETAPIGVPEWFNRLHSAQRAQRLLDRLISRGALSMQKTMLGNKRYPERDPSLRLEIRGRIDLALGGEPPSRRTAALLALLSACELAVGLFPDADGGQIAAIIEKDWVGEAVRHHFQRSRRVALRSAINMD